MEHGLTHFDSQGNAIMVDVSEKAVTHRVAVASGRIFVNAPVYEAIVQGTVKKGDVLGLSLIHIWSVSFCCYLFYPYR